MIKNIQNLNQNGINSIICGGTYCACKCCHIGYKEKLDIFDAAVHQSELFETQAEFSSSQLPFGKILGEQTVSNSRQDCMNFCSSYLESFLSCKHISNN